MKYYLALFLLLSAATQAGITQKDLDAMGLADPMHQRVRPYRPVQIQMPRPEERPKEPGVILCPDGTYIRGEECRWCQDGTYKASACRMGPDGKFY